MTERISNIEEYVAEHDSWLNSRRKYTLTEEVDSEYLSWESLQPLEDNWKELPEEQRLDPNTTWGKSEIREFGFWNEEYVEKQRLKQRLESNTTWGELERRDFVFWIVWESEEHTGKQRLDPNTSWVDSERRDFTMGQ